MSRRGSGYIRPGYDPLEVPDAPTIGSATAGNESVSITFTAPSDVGGSAITGYGAVAQNSADGTTTAGTGSSSPVTVSSLTNGDNYTAAVWALNVYGPSPFSASTTSFSPSNPQRALVIGNGNTSIDYFDINTLGNAAFFGSIVSTGANESARACSSSTRAIFFCYDTIRYVTIATTGNASTFGSMASNSSSYPGAVSNETRGILALAGTYGSPTNYTQYVTIASTGTSTSGGTLATSNIRQIGGSVQSTTRGFFFGGYTTGGSAINSIEYVTIATASSGTDFGDLTYNVSVACGTSSSTRGLMFGGYNSTSRNEINYITMASAGNATDFGNLAVATQAPGGTSNKIRGVICGGYTTAYSNVIQYVTIASTGNAADFGDMTYADYTCSACSDSHGGLA